MPAVPLEARRGRWVPLERELQMAVSYHVGAGNQTAVGALNTWAISPSQQLQQQP